MHPHRFEPASLIFGLLFTGLGLVPLTGDLGLWRLDWSWFWPLVLLIGGGAVLQSLRPGPDPGRSEPDDRNHS